MKLQLNLTVAVAAMAIGLSLLAAGPCLPPGAGHMHREAAQTLNTLYKNNPGAKALGDKAVAVLVFPSIVKGGFIIAGQFGDGALRKNGKTAGYYRSLAASYGFQAGAQSFGYVLFFMDDDSV